MGHYAGNFPSYTSSKYAGSQSLHMGLTMAQTTNYAPLNDIINPIFFYLIHAPPSAPSRTNTSLKTSAPVTQANNSGLTKTGDTITTTILPP